MEWYFFHKKNGAVKLHHTCEESENKLANTIKKLYLNMFTW